MLRTLEKYFPKFFLSEELIGPLVVCRDLKSVTGRFLVKSVSLGKYISNVYSRLIYVSIIYVICIYIGVLVRGVGVVVL